VPVYNGERFLRETLDSLVRQTFKDCEIIVSDNASTDGTAEICKTYARADGRIRYVKNDINLGSARNFNQTLDLARGDYFKSASADDLCEPDLVEKCVSVLDTMPEVVLCYARSVLIDERGTPIRPYDDNLNLREASAAERFRKAIERVRMVNVLQGVVRTAALRKTGKLGTYRGSDMVLAPEIALYGQIYELPERLFFRRIHPGAFSSLGSAEHEQEFVNPGVRQASGYYARHFREYVQAVWRAPLERGDRIRLLSWILRRAIAARGELWRETLASLAAVLRQ
jgi:glycosyltransferase involved in cell wall biosynthesis